MKLTLELKAGILTALYMFLFFLLAHFSLDVFIIITFSIGVVFVVDMTSQFLKKIFRIPIPIGKVIILVIFFVLLFTLFVFLVPTVIKEIGNFLGFLSDFFDKKQWQNVIGNVQPSMKKNIDEFMLNLKPKILALLNSYLEKLPSYGQKTVTFVFFFVITSIFMSFYLDFFKTNIGILYTKKTRNVGKRFMRELYINLQHFVVATLLAALFVGIAAFFLFSFMDLRYKTLLSFWAGVTNFIPIVGVVVEFIPLIIVGASLGVSKLLILLLSMSIIHGAAFIIFLFLMKDYAKMNPVMIILAILIMGHWLSIVGALIAVPTLMAIQIFWKMFIQPEFERR